MACECMHACMHAYSMERSGQLCSLHCCPCCPCSLSEQVDPPPGTAEADGVGEEAPQGGEEENDEFDDEFDQVFDE